MNQFVAIRRRVSAVMVIVAMMATVALLSGLMPALSRAQADAKPADPAPTSEPAADTGKKAKKAPKPPKIPKPARVEKVVKAATPTRAKAEKSPKAPKVAKAKQPEKSPEEQKKEDGVYSKGSNWLTLRFGYAKRTGDLSGDGLVGYGLGYTHLINRNYAFGAGVGHDILGHFRSQIDEAVPFTAEFERHYNWHTSVRPYVGLGGGFYLRKNYRTGTEYSTRTTGGPHLSVGFTSELDAKHVVGFETRVARIQGRPGVVNPTFGRGEQTETIWTAMISWALVY